ncbi:DEAD/DEAH box helicase [Wolbachia endosymbiont of Ctenocephalides felis wCfeJ]|uniref:DEAD/DEAH box helicase n=1 Tax=Wolbachia endosymbiont of Ctenocephalides felis wCfeJ TaxID=2732594 RepID=UPI001FE2EE39|nr:DEAD/DEAH box helicase [Wolbachia endosymbiont of Ctenocephalides felis wCfeJ]
MYGRTLWGKKWLQCLGGAYCSNRLQRGKTYANDGRVSSIKINGNVIIAAVRGSGQSYRVKVILREFNASEKRIIHQIIKTSPAILSRLINRRLPSSLLDKIDDLGIKLFPSSWEEIKTISLFDKLNNFCTKLFSLKWKEVRTIDFSDKLNNLGIELFTSKRKEVSAKCNCPDGVVPCKHIAAVIYLIAKKIDKNPLLVFSIRNCDLLAFIDDFWGEKLRNVQKVSTIDNTLKPLDQVTSDQTILDNINFSTIPDLANYIYGILTSDPLFFEQDFYSILKTAYKHWKRYPVGNQSFKEEELFIARWGNIENWQTFQLFVSDRYQLTQVSNGINKLFIDDDNLPKNLAQFLNDIPSSLLHKLNPELRFMHMISRFARMLMKKSALIPQILQNKRGEIIIRWVPALFNESVKEFHRKISSMCPPLLVQYQEIPIEPEEQVNVATSLILLGYITDNFPKSFDEYKYASVFTLFFTGKYQKFHGSIDEEKSQIINVWLSHLYLTDKPYKFHLIVRDHYDRFELDIQISLDGIELPMKLDKALPNQNEELRLSILSGLAFLLEHMPELEESIDNNSTLFLYLDSFSSVFTDTLPILREIGIVVVLPESLQKASKHQFSLNLSTQDKIKEEDDDEISMMFEDILKFDWRVAIGDKEFSVSEFKKLLKHSRKLVRIADQYVLLDEKRAEDLLKRLDRLPNSLNRAEFMQAVLTGELDKAKIVFDQQLTDLSNKLNIYTPVTTPNNLIAQLRPYQERGFSWLVQNIENRFGSIIADDMGLGKTIQVIAAILYCKNAGFLDQGGVLIVTPTSILSNWQREVERFAPGLKLLIYHGQDRELTSGYDVVLTSYGLTYRDKKELNEVRWFMLVIDEAQNIKNPHSEQTKAVKAIKARCRIAMSGTPVENRLLEYWSIFDFTNRSYLGSATQFKTNFAIPIEKERDKSCLERFMKITSPFILRRLKSDKSIIKDLPDKIENNRYCFLTPEQTALYQEVVNTTMKKIEGSKGIERKGLILKLINSLKQICNHPSHFGKKKHASIEQSGKMQMLEEILIGINELAEESLIFTQYTAMGEIMTRLLEERFNSTIPFLHGGLPLKARDEMVSDFQNSFQSNILIVSLKAGGTGLNLTAANHVIHYDLWWNPAVEAQATDRAYRIGQERNVMVYRLLSTGTFEERIDEMIQSKKELANLTISSGENWITEFNNDQLKDLVNIRTCLKSS